MALSCHSSLLSGSFIQQQVQKTKQKQKKQTKKQQGIVLHIHYMLRARSLQVFSKHVGSDIEEF